MNKKYILIVILVAIIAGIAVWALKDPPEPQEGLTSEECVAAEGRVFNTADEGFCEENEISIGNVKGFAYLHVCCVSFPESKRLIVEEAIEIAGNSECIEKGSLIDQHTYNPNSHTWWIDLEMKEEFKKDYCDPACVVSEWTKTAEINWRCTGALPPETEEEDLSQCAEDGGLLREPDEYCCEGLKEWSPIPDTRFSIADVCYEVGSPSESNIGMCIKCGDGICENHPIYDENPCNCPEDCAGKNKSMFQGIEEFCQSNDWKMSLSKACEEQEPIKGSPICELCP